MSFQFNPPGFFYPFFYFCLFVFFLFDVCPRFCRRLRSRFAQCQIKGLFAHLFCVSESFDFGPNPTFDFNFAGSPPSNEGSPPAFDFANLNLAVQVGFRKRRGRDNLLFLFFFFFF